MRDLAPWPGCAPVPPAVQVQGLNHWQPGKYISVVQIIQFIELYYISPSKINIYTIINVLSFDPEIRVCNFMQQIDLQLYVYKHKDIH